MKKDLLSVLILSYNHSSYIEQCIKSVFNNDYKNVEIIALDDGSKDNSVEILNKLKENSPYPLTVISQENSGNIGKNFNTLFKKSKGEYIAFIAADDYFCNQSFKEKIELMQADKNVMFVCNCQIDVVDENSIPIENYSKMKLDKIKNPNSKDILNLEYKKAHSYYIQGTIYKREIIEKINGFDEDMICDDIILRTKIANYLLKNKKLKFKVLKKPACKYRRHRTNISSNNLRQIKGLLEYYSRYWQNFKPTKGLIEMVAGLKFNCSKEEYFKIINCKYLNKIFKNLSDENFNNDDFICYKSINILNILKINKYMKKEGKETKVFLFNKQIYTKNK